MRTCRVQPDGISGLVVAELVWLLFLKGLCLQYDVFANEASGYSEARMNTRPIRAEPPRGPAADTRISRRIDP